MNPIRLSTGTHENFRTVTVVEALRLLAPTEHGLVPTRRMTATKLPLGVSPVLAAVAIGASDVSWERNRLDPDELLRVLPSLHGTSLDLDGERKRLDHVADDFLEHGLPELLRAATNPAAGRPGEVHAQAMVRLAELLPLGRPDITGHENDAVLLGAKLALIRLYQDQDAANRKAGISNGSAPSPAWRCLGALEAFENGVRGLRDVEGAYAQTGLRDGDDPENPWVRSRVPGYATADDTARLADVARAAESFARARTLATLALRLVGEAPPFSAPGLIERLAAAHEPSGPAPR